VVARDHSVDIQTNVVSLFSVIDSVSELAAPVALPQFVVLTLWAREEGEEGVTFVERVALVSPSGQQCAQGDVSFRLEKRRHRNIFTVVNPRFEQTGTYKVRVSLRREDVEDWATAFEYPIEVAIGETGSGEQLFPEQP